MSNKSKNIKFDITPDQAKQICAKYNADYDSAEEYEISELLDRLIDETTTDL